MNTETVGENEYDGKMGMIELTHVKVIPEMNGKLVVNPYTYMVVETWLYHNRKERREIMKNLYLDYQLHRYPKTYYLTVTPYIFD